MRLYCTWKQTHILWLQCKKQTKMFCSFQGSQEDNHLDVRDRTTYTERSCCQNKASYHTTKFDLFKPEDLTRDSVITWDLVWSLIIKWFSLTGLSSIMSRILPYSYNVLRASVWKLTVSLNFLNVSSVCSRRLLMKIIKKKSRGWLFNVVPSRHKMFPVISYFSFYIKISLSFVDTRPVILKTKGILENTQKVWKSRMFYPHHCAENSLK